MQFAEKLGLPQNIVCPRGSSHRDYASETGFARKKEFHLNLMETSLFQEAIFQNGSIIKLLEVPYHSQLVGNFHHLLFLLLYNRN